MLTKHHKLSDYASIEERLFDKYKLDSKTGCWLFLGAKNEKGYGLIRIKGKLIKIHRLSYEFFIGLLINDALHIKQCPNRNCFNPTHLYDGTHQDNMRDRDEIYVDKTS